MGHKKHGLGKGLSDLGLSELLSGASSDPVAVAPPKEEYSTLSKDMVNKKSLENNKIKPEQGQLNYLPVDRIKAGHYQPRSHFNKEALEELAQSIKSQGIIQPLVVRQMNDGYEIVAGERRWRAAQLAGLSEVPVLIRDLPDKSVLAMSLIENIQRQDLNAIEEAVALNRLLNEFNLTHQEVADSVGKSRTNVSNLLRLLKLNVDVKQMLEQSELEMGHARALLALEGYQQSETAKQVVKKRLSVRQTEAWIRQILEPKVSSAKAKVVNDPDVARLQNRISETLGAPVSIKHQAKGNGQLVIQYHSLEELDGILEHIK